MQTHFDPTQTPAQQLLRTFQQVRQENTPLPEIIRTSLFTSLSPGTASVALASPLGKALLKLGTTIQHVADTETRVLDYHNIAHFRETVLAVAQLSALEFTGSEQPRAVMLAMLAMSGHDFLHDGTSNTPIKSLEALAWNACAPHLSGLEDTDKTIIQAMIMGTEPTRLDEHRAVYTSSVAAPSMVDRLKLLACEADLTPSLLPGHGNAMGFLYAAELAKSGIPSLVALGEHIASWSSRLGFLHHVQPISEAAHKMGLTDMMQHQLEAFSLLADELGFATPKEAARYLDDLATVSGFSASQQLYLTTLSRVDASLARAVREALYMPSKTPNVTPTM